MTVHKPKYQNSSFDINAVEFIIWADYYSNKEVGQIMRTVREKCLEGDFHFLKQFKWIDRIYKGHQKRKSLPLNIRRQVLSAGKCLYCGTTQQLTVDHIIAVTKGGSDDISNLQCLCFLCNVKKSNK